MPGRAEGGIASAMPSEATPWPPQLTLQNHKP
jgi:hypothetical protein